MADWLEAMNVLPSKSWQRLLVASAVGLALCTGGIWVLARSLDEDLPRYQGQTLFYWLKRADSQDVTASNQACLVLNSSVIPRLTQTMFHDTNDSRFRLALIDQLNALPGVFIHSTVANDRRVAAALALGQIGPRAKATIPDLVKVLRGNDPAPRPAAAFAAGRIHSEPETIIPLLAALLDDPQDGVREMAATSLGEFGGLSKAAVPQLLELFKLRSDKDLNNAVAVALKQIDPGAATKAGIR
jgi:hypothetical protein